MAPFNPGFCTQVFKVEPKSGPLMQLCNVGGRQVTRKTAQHDGVGNEVWGRVGPLNNLNVVDHLLQGKYVDTCFKLLKTF